MISSAAHRKQQNNGACVRKITVRQPTHDRSAVCVCAYLSCWWLRRCVFVHPKGHWRCSDLKRMSWRLLAPVCVLLLQTTISDSKFRWFTTVQNYKRSKLQWAFASHFPLHLFPHRPQLFILQASRFIVALTAEIETYILILVIKEQN